MLQLHPDNPHYLLFRGKPTVLVGSGEHYGAVLNLDFDYVRYLDAVQQSGLNVVRLFSGTYREIVGSFNIAENTLAPAPDRFICPWARSDTPGETLGGNKFDLRRYDPAYFARLKDFIAHASRRGVVVELVLFCVMYEETLWHVCPMWAGNNVNGVGDFESGRERPYPYTPEDNDLLPIQLDFVRKIAGELREFDNVYYEIINEPYITDKAGSHFAWQNRVIDALVEAESSFPARHLIAQGIANRSARIADPHPAVSIFNFHCSEPSSVLDNYHLDRVISHDEDGFAGTAIAPYRRQTWSFMMSGGAIVSHLDYSFTVKRPDGTSPIPEQTPGSGGAELRKQWRILKEFMESFDFIRMKPDSSVILRRGAEIATAHALSDSGKAYAIYVCGGTGADLTVPVAAGRYRAEWINPVTGDIEESSVFDHAGGAKSLALSKGCDEIALRILRN